MKRLLSAIAAFSLVAAAPHALAQAPAATEASSADPVWAFEQSDLPVDPDFRFGVLDNGLRYIVRKNSNPQGQAEVRLLIEAGSTSESDDELGYAHFIEHMAFNGSTRVPEGEMVKLLEREGLAFGADTNASTSFDATLYKLDLPRSDPQLLDTALMLMRETASELTFDEEAVERERGVVLSELRVRDTYALRNVMDRFGFLYPDALFVKRLPAGTVEALTAANSARLRALYLRTYTPKNAAVVVVGDFDPELMEAEIVEHFAGWQAAPGVADPPREPDKGPVDPAIAGKTAIFINPALSEQVTASRNGAYIDEPDTIASRQTNLLRQVGYGSLNRRFQRIANGDAPPFRAASFSTGDVFEAGRTTNLSVQVGDGEWQGGLATAVAEYRRALAYGFSEAEVAEQVAIIRTSLENVAALGDTRYNSTHTNAALGLLQDDTIPTTPESALERFENFVDRITPEAVLAALRDEAIPLDDPLLRFEGRTPPEGGEDALRAAWDAAMAAPVERPADEAAAEFGYTDFGTPGTVVADSVDERLGIRTLAFANGVRLNLKRTDLKRDRISFELNLDGGDMLNTRDDPLATAMIGVLPLGGLGKHSYDELQTILAGRSVALGINSNGETFTMQGTTTARDLELQLELLAASITDPGYRPQGEERYRRSIADFFARRNATPASALGNALGEIVSDGDPRFTIQPEGAYLALNFERLKQAISGRLAHGAIELALVGDFDEDAAIALVARTLGALPEREPDFLPYDENRARSFTADRSRRTVYHTGEADQAMLRMVWPTRDDSDLAENVKLELLEQVVQVELIEVLREALGQTYSPGVDASQSRFHRGYGTFSVMASLDVEDIDAARAAIVETLESLRAEPVPEDVLLRARMPMVEAYENVLKTNNGWLDLTDRAQSESERIDRFLKGRELLKEITAEDLRAVAERYLDPAQALEVLALPQPKAEPTAE